MSDDTTNATAQTCTATSVRRIERTAHTVTLACQRRGVHHAHRDPERGFWSDDLTEPVDPAAEVRRVDDAAFAMWRRGSWDEMLPALVPELRQVLADAADRAVARINATSYHPQGYSGMVPVDRPWQTLPAQRTALAAALAAALPVEDRADLAAYLSVGLDVRDPRAALIRRVRDALEEAL
ncbi:hypothetical protein [Micromonospora sp. RP3T]|uniref:hypothetical protein n=1 Tax=Micromonospora sp. RP3T TaxID=2135446 RepID=UPI003D710C93